VLGWAILPLVQCASSKNEPHPQTGRYIRHAGDGISVLNLLENNEYVLPGIGDDSTSTRGFYAVRGDTLFLSITANVSQPLLIRGDSLVYPNPDDSLPAYIKAR
jgi:hypothetical protein